MKFYFYLVYFVLLKEVMSQENMTETEPEPDIMIKYEMINETLFCISKGEGYSKELVSFAQKNRTVNDYFDFDIEELYSFIQSDEDKKFIDKCRKRAYFNIVFPYKRKDIDIRRCNSDSEEDQNFCYPKIKYNYRYLMFEKLKRRRRRMNSNK